MTLSEEIKIMLNNKLSYLQRLRANAVSIGDITEILSIDNKIAEVTALLEQLAT